MKFFKVKIFDPAAKKIFPELVSSNMKYREENNIKINGLINLLMQVKKESFGKKDRLS